MTEITDYGTVTDYATGESIRPATREEWECTAAVVAAGGPGSYTGAWPDMGHSGRAVYVDGGPETDDAEDL